MTKLVQGMPVLMKSSHRLHGFREREAIEQESVQRGIGSFHGDIGEKIAAGEEV